MNKKNLRSSVIYSGIFLLVFLLVTIYRQTPNHSITLTPVSSFDYLFLGEIPENLDLSTQDYSASTEDTALSKDACDLLSYASYLEIPISFNDRGNAYAENFCNLDSTFDLKIVSDSLPVYLDYLPDEPILRFYSPGILYDLDNQLIPIQEKVLAEFNNVFSNSIIQICNDFTSLNEYRNSKRYSLKELAACDVTQMIPKDTNLLGTQSQFSRENWLEHPGEIQNPEETEDYHVFNSSREALPSKEVSLSSTDDSVTIAVYQQTVYLANRVTADLNPYTPYFFSFDYSVGEEGGHIGYAYRFITQEYLDDLESIRNDHQVDKITTYTNDTSYPTFDYGSEKLYVSQFQSGTVNRIIKPTIDNIIGIEIFLFSGSEENSFQVTFSDLSLSEVESQILTDFRNIKDTLSDNIGGITLASGITIKDNRDQIQSDQIPSNLISVADNFLKSSTRYQTDISDFTDCPVGSIKDISNSSETSSDAAEGSVSVISDSNKPTAAIAATFFLDPIPPGNYILSFDYKNTAGGSFGYAVRVNSENSEVPPLYKTGCNVIETTQDDWTTFQVQLPIDERAYQAQDIYSVDLLLFSPANTSVRTANLFDNVRIYSSESDSITYRNVYLEAQNPQVSSESSSAETTPLDQGSALAEVDKSGLFFMPSAYSDSTTMSGPGTPKHFAYNNTSTLWLINETGAYTIRVTTSRLLSIVQTLTLTLAIIAAAVGLMSATIPTYLADIQNASQSFGARYVHGYKSMSISIARLNNWVALSVVKPSIAFILGTRSISYRKICETRDKALLSLDSMLQRISTDISTRPVDTLLIILLAVGFGLLTNVNYSPYVAIMILWVRFQWDSRLLGIGALIQLLIVPVLLLFEREKFAEYLAISTYLFLTMTVVMQIIEYRRDKMVR